MTSNRTFFVAMVLVLLAGTDAGAVDIAERCESDQLSSPETVRGRNLWALVCHLISKMDYDCAVANGYYWTFNSTTGGANQAPTRPGQSCAGFRRFTMCPSGCFEATQALAFGARYAPPSRAFADEVDLVTTLAPDAQLGRLSFTESKIKTYVRGRERRDLIEINTPRRRLRVTHNHPMLRADGGIVAAEAVHVGDRLLMQDGAATVQEVGAVAYDGLVWNVKPQSVAPKANVLVAEGFLTGSLRFQNEWANDAARLALRQSLVP